MMEANHEIIEAVPICTKCGKKLSKVNTSFFDRDGDDNERSVEFTCCKNESGEYALCLDVDTSWCGYELSNEEKMEMIRCPHCGKYPFDDKLGVEEDDGIYCVTCWTKNAEEIPPSQAGNMAKMREALKSAYDVLDKLLYSLWMEERKKDNLICKTKRIIEEALSAPARNCDVLETEELIRQHNSFCGNSKNSYKCINAPASECRRCLAKFMQMTHESEAKKQ